MRTLIPTRTEPGNSDRSLGSRWRACGAWPSCDGIHPFTLLPSKHSALSTGTRPAPLPITMVYWEGTPQRLSVYLMKFYATPPTINTSNTEFIPYWNGSAPMISNLRMYKSMNLWIQVWHKTEMSTLFPSTCINWAIFETSVGWWFWGIVQTDIKRIYTMWRFPSM